MFDIDEDFSDILARMGIRIEHSTRQTAEANRELSIASSGPFESIQETIEASTPRETLRRAALP